MKRSFGQHLLATASLSLLMTVAQAQAIYRIVAPDGRVTFSDKQAEAPGKAAVAGSARAASGPTTDNLPFELRQTSIRFPVTLYTGDNCGPCTSGRTLLSSRGIPFTERTISTQQDIEALKRLSGASSLPFLMIGGQKIRGFLETEWMQYLDAAGYPASSQLPSGYRNPPPTPLVAPPKPVPVEAPPQSAGEPPPEAEPTRPPAFNPGNPAGIIF